MGYLYQIPPVKAQESLQRRKQMDFKSQRYWITPREKHLPDKTGLINMNSETDSMQKTYTDSKQTKFQY